MQKNESLNQLDDKLSCNFCKKHLSVRDNFSKEPDGNYICSTCYNIMHTPVNTKGKIGRNQECPCGSGLKYKKCCLLKK